MRGLTAVIIFILFANYLVCKPEFIDQSLSKGIKSTSLDRSSKNAYKLFKNRPAKKTRVAALKYKRSKVKGLKTTQLLSSETLPQKIYVHYRHVPTLIQDVYLSFLYCVKYKRGPPLS